MVPSGRVKFIQPFETGIVRAIRVHDGQSVKAGDVLIDLDPTMSTADEEHIKSDLIAAQLDVARLRATLADDDDPQAAFQPPAGASADRQHAAAIPSQADRRISGEARFP